MEFPDLGQHCSNSSCKQLDFLPMKCDACSKIFCDLQASDSLKPENSFRSSHGFPFHGSVTSMSVFEHKLASLVSRFSFCKQQHIKYDTHGCEEGYKKDVQVPVCPLCNKPVPGRRDEAPDIRVSEHIDRDCQSDRAVKKRKVFANKCSKKGCKQKELMPIVCDSCRLNFCLKHRHALDHACKGHQGNHGSGITTNSGFAAVNRAQSSSNKTNSKQQLPKSKREPQKTTLVNIGADLARERREREMSRQRTTPPVSNVYSMQAGMSEDEAMARALQLSLASDAGPPSDNVPPTQTQQEEADLALARALAQSEDEQRRQQNQGTQRQQSSGSSKCAVS
ncbi:putative AN1-type zinc finger protein 2B-like isoform X1 [Apostichopus japonicus]|uniref:Putative AN1-type zinc finger protein 2B-like isoform X1 n=1 Tax=Stichopus japonicus TaxID=307972 RepID=A0A2G8KHT9_STIJA|nr:putative AN1-type zinc finger protein 2B-like isoform X1 [Apostichopus japonicus]